MKILKSVFLSLGLSFLLASCSQDLDQSNKMLAALAYSSGSSSLPLPADKRQTLF